MTTAESIVKQIQSALEHEPRINLHSHPIRVNVFGGTAFLDGEVENIAVKRLAAQLAAATDGVRRVTDRLRVAPAQRKGDGATRDAVCNFLLQEPALRNCSVKVHDKGRLETLRDISVDPGGSIEISLQDGVATLDGWVISLSHRRLAGVLAWWAPGCRDVVNNLRVEPPERDSDDEITDALLLVLEKDPLLDADQIRVSTRDRVVTLEGFVNTEEDRKMAEWDAWYVAGVNQVINNILVRK
ncbi:MAG: BON domain-containing protein [Pseudomonadota bacterium]